MSPPRFTTRHPRSSHRLPVLVIDGQAYGPGDMRLAEIFPDVDFGGMPDDASFDRAVVEAWSIATARSVAAAPPPPHATENLLDLLNDPRDAQEQRVRAWLSQHAAGIRAIDRR